MTESKYKKRFDNDYKREIVRLVDELGKSPTQVAEDIGVSPQTVRAWVRKFGKADSDAFHTSIDRLVRHRLQKAKRKWYFCCNTFFL